MRKINLKTHLVPAFCLMLFVGFTQAQTDGNEPPEETGAADVRAKPARQENRPQPQLQIKKWARLKEGMTEKQVRSLLGDPKLIQGGSDECTWFYQHLPDLNARGKVNGTVTFKAKPLKQLLEEEKTEHIKNIEKLNETYQTKCCPDRDFTVSWSTGSHCFYETNAGYRYVSPPCDDPSLRCICPECRPRPCVCNCRICDPNSYFEDDDSHCYSLPAIRVGRYCGDDRQAMMKKAVRYEGQFKKFVNDYGRAVKRLSDELGPRDPVFQLVSFNPPDSQIEYSPTREGRVHITAQDANDRWNLPRNWRQLKINMAVNQVHSLLGQPEKSKINGQCKKEYYGDVSDYGELRFSARSGRNPEERLDSWTEPFWPMVKTSLNTENQADIK